MNIQPVMKQLSHIQHTAVENLLGNVKKSVETVEKPVERVEKPMFSKAEDLWKTVLQQVICKSECINGKILLS